MEHPLLLYNVTSRVILSSSSVAVVGLCAQVCKAWRAAVKQEDPWVAATVRELESKYGPVARVQVDLDFEAQERSEMYLQEFEMLRDHPGLALGVDLFDFDVEEELEDEEEMAERFEMLTQGLRHERPAVTAMAFEAVEACLCHFVGEMAIPPNLYKNGIALFGSENWCKGLIRAAGSSLYIVIRKVACDCLQRTLLCFPSLAPKLLDLGVAAALKRSLLFANPGRFAAETRLNLPFKAEQDVLLSDGAEYADYGPRFTRIQSREAICRAAQALASASALCQCRARAVSVENGALLDLLVHTQRPELSALCPSIEVPFRSLFALAALVSPPRDVGVGAPDTEDFNAAVCKVLERDAAAHVLNSIDFLMFESFNDVRNLFGPGREIGFELVSLRYFDLDADMRLRCLSVVAGVGFLSSLSLHVDGRAALMQLNPRLQRVLKAVITQTGYHRYQMNTKRLNTMMDEDTDSYLAMYTIGIEGRGVDDRVYHVLVRDSEMAMATLSALGLLKGEGTMGERERVKKRGNIEYQEADDQGVLEHAQWLYFWAARIAGNHDPEGTEGGGVLRSGVAKKGLSILLSNRAQAYIKMARWPQAIAAAESALAADESNPKAAHRLRQAMAGIEEAEKEGLTLGVEETDDIVARLEGCVGEEDAEDDEDDEDEDEDEDVIRGMGAVNLQR